MFIRHYLVITFFAVFYGALKWVYRQHDIQLKHSTSEGTDLQ